MNLDFYDNRTVAYCDECTLPLSICDCERPMKRKIGLSKTRPTSEVVQGPPSRGRRRVALNREARMSEALAALPDAEPEVKAMLDAAIENSPCTEPPVEVQSPHMAITPSSKGQKIMTLTLKGLDKRGRNAIYTGLAVAIRVPVGAFPDKQPAQTLEIEGAVAGPKQKLTAEERKAARKAAPKPTAAEKAQKLEKRLAKLREQAAKETVAEQPSL